MKDFHSLAVWQKSHQLALKIYQVSTGFPKEELFGITNQIRRAAVSIPANIAEGCGRNGDAELGRFLSIALGSASEVEYFLQLSVDLNYLDAQKGIEITAQVTEIKRMLSGLMTSLKSTR